MKFVDDFMIGRNDRSLHAFIMDAQPLDSTPNGLLSKG